MKTKIIIFGIAFLALGCVSKKKYVDLESQLAMVQDQKESCEARISDFENRVREYNDRIAQLRAISDSQMTSVDDVVVMSENTKRQMRETLRNVDPNEVAGAKTVLDSMNLAIKYNLSRGLEGDVGDDLHIDIEQTVVVINISDNFLFRSAGYDVGTKGQEILGKLAMVINQQPGLQVLVEGHTDSKSIRTGMFRNNWDLSVKRAASVVSILQEKFSVDPSRMIAAGRSSYQPIATNDTKEGRAQNRRTRIVILPELEKLFALLAP